MNQVPKKELGHSWSIDLGLSGASKYFEPRIKEVSLDHMIWSISTRPYVMAIYGFQTKTNLFISF